MVLQFLRSITDLPRAKRLLSLVFILSMLLLYPLGLSAEEIAIIVNIEGPLTHITKSQVREIYLGEVRFMKGEPIIPIHYPEGPIKDTVLNEIIGKSSKAYKLHWAKKVFQEGLMLPRVKTDPDNIILWVRRNSGAIGYAPKGLVNGDPRLHTLFVVEPRRP